MIKLLLLLITITATAQNITIGKFEVFQQNILNEWGYCQASYIYLNDMNTRGIYIEPEYSGNVMIAISERELNYIITEYERMRELGINNSVKDFKKEINRINSRFAFAFVDKYYYGYAFAIYSIYFNIKGEAYIIINSTTVKSTANSFITYDLSPTILDYKMVMDLKEIIRDNNVNEKLEAEKRRKSQQIYLNREVKK